MQVPRMKLLMAADGLMTGGIERQLVELLKGIVASGRVQCEVAILSPEIHFPEVFELGIPVHVLERRRRKDPRVLAELFRIVRAFRPDVAHSWGSMSSIYLLPLVPLFRLQLVNAMIQDAPRELRIFDPRWLRSRLSFPFSAAIVANSHAGLRSYGAPGSRSHCIRNGFDFARLEHLADAARTKRELAISTPRVVGMVAGFTEKKDHRTFLMAASEIVSKRRDVTFVAVGDGKTLEPCRRLFDPKHGDRILLPGRRSDVESIVDVFDIGVLATYTEGISNSIMEYMALGKPVVATDGGGTSELVVNGETGFLVKQGSVAELVERIDHLLSHPTQAIAMGRAGQQKIRREFSLEKLTSSFLELYDGLPRRSSHPRSRRAT